MTIALKHGSCRSVTRCAAILVCVAAQAISAQNSASAQANTRLPEFEVATVKHSDLNGGGEIGVLTYPGGRVHAGFCTLKMLLEEAFDVKEFLIEGGPKWIDNDRFDVEAIPPDSSAARKLNPPDSQLPMSREQRQMMQALLIDRFGLKYHFETRSSRVYLMVASGPKVNLTTTSKPDLAPRFTVTITSDGVGQGEMVATNASMPFIASRLSEIMGVPVVDRTGIDGAFDFDIPPPEAANTERTDGAISGLKVLGLKLKASKGEVQALIVDAASEPGPN